MKIIFLLLLLISSHHGALSQIVDKNTLENEATWIRKQMQEHHIPYVGIGIIRKGKLQQIKAYGEHITGQPAPYNTIINVASLTKPVVAMLTLKLVSNGSWNLDEPLFKYWVDPDVKNDPRSKQLTSRHVLTHQTGFINWRWNHPSQKLTFDHDPGTKFGYSGEGFMYLKKALESKFGKKLENLVDSLVFKPLQMKDSYMVFDKRIDQSRVAAWHDTLGKPVYNNIMAAVAKSTVANAADDLVTTVEDYGKFMVAVMNGFGLSKELYADMIKPHSLMRPDHYMGLGWGITLNLFGKEPVINHEGSDVGIRSLVFWLPDSKEGLIIFTNADNGYKIFKEMVEVRWRGSILAGAK
jgi:CubicO group peptidase (beta-lactamase class C family)